MCALVFIDVDVNHLWKTAQPFKVYSAEYMNGYGEQDGEYYKGFVIKMKVDPRDLKKFRFSAHVYNHNTVVVTAPALDFHDEGGDALEEDVAKDTKPDPRGDNLVIWEALTHGRLEFRNRKIDNKMQYHLRFNGGVTLSSEVLRVHREQREGRMTVEAVNVAVDVDSLNQGELEPVIDEEGHEVTDEHGHILVKYNQYFVGSLIWRVADITSGTRKHAASRAAEAPTDGFEAMFGAMNMGV